MDTVQAMASEAREAVYQMMPNAIKIGVLTWSQGPKSVK
jgi:hypothetical protein